MECLWRLDQSQRLPVPVLSLLAVLQIFRASDAAAAKAANLSIQCAADSRLLLVLASYHHRITGRRAAEWLEFVTWMSCQTNKLEQEILAQLGASAWHTPKEIQRQFRWIGPSEWSKRSVPRRIRRLLIRSLDNKAALSLPIAKRIVRHNVRKRLLKTLWKCLPTSGEGVEQVMATWVLQAFLPNMPPSHPNRDLSPQEETPIPPSPADASEHYSSPQFCQNSDFAMGDISNVDSPAGDSPSQTTCVENASSADFSTQLQTEKLRSLRLLAYGASHEINNPLANISIRAETLAKSEVDPARRKKLITIHQQAMRAHQMISDLMLFANPPPVEAQVVDLKALVGQVVEELRNQLTNAQIIIKRNEPNESLLIDSDPKQIAEAIKAILKNSIESIGSEGEIQITLEPTEANGVAVTVQDSGIGIAESILPSIFDPFFSGREAGRGLGFGLSKAWRIMDDHQGEIRCLNPSPGQTTFQLIFPGSRRAFEGPSGI